MKTRKILSVLLVIALALSLAACGSSSAPAASANTGSSSSSGSSGSSSSTPAAAPADAGGTAGSTKASPNCNEDGSVNLDKVAHFDAEYDYSQNKGWRLAYLCEDSGPLYQETAAAAELWCAKMNIEWVGMFCSHMDMDLFMSTLQNYIDQGVQMFIIDPDSATLETVKKFLDGYPDVYWFSHMSAPRKGIDGDMLAPYVGFDHIDAGYQMMKRLDQWKQDTIPDVDWSEIGILHFDYSSSHQLHERQTGVQQYLAEAGIPEDNFYVADCVSTGLDMQGGIDAASPIISTYNFKYWVVVGNIDDWALAAANILEQQGLTDTSCVVAFGGSGAAAQWDAGQSNAYRYALFCANSLYEEPTVGAIYAFANGWATPETIWPSWINHNDCGGENGTYAQLRLPVVWLDQDTYKSYLKWTDVYSGGSIYGYDDVEVDTDAYSPFVEEVPASYAKQ